jgi:hypothetical protein
MAYFKNLQITPDALLRGSEMFEALDKRDNTIGIINVDVGIAERQNATTIALEGMSPSRGQICVSVAVKDCDQKKFRDHTISTSLRLRRVRVDHRVGP